MDTGNTFDVFVPLDGVSNGVAIGEPTSPSIVRPSSVLSLRADEYVFARSSDWDGLGSTAIAPEIERLAQDLIALYGGSRDLVEVGPGADGSLSFVWEEPQSGYIYVDVGPKLFVHVYYDIPGLGTWEGVGRPDDPRLIHQLRLSFDAFYHRPASLHAHTRPTGQTSVRIIAA